MNLSESSGVSHYVSGRRSLYLAVLFSQGLLNGNCAREEHV